MASGITEGRELAKKFRGIAQKATTELESSLNYGALLIERSAKIKTPVDTGRLRASITHRLENSDKENPSAVIGTNVKYAKYVEFGSSKAPAQPFLQPAYNENIENIKRNIGNAIKRSLKG